MSLGNLLCDASFKAYGGEILAGLTEVSDRVPVLRGGTFFQEFRGHKATQRVLILAVLLIIRKSAGLIAPRKKRAAAAPRKEA